jgi:DNA topoisomerase-3
MLIRDINRAAQNPSELDMRTVDAVKARSELDLRIGAAFTRLQSLRIRDLFYPTEWQLPIPNARLHCG